MSDSKKSYSAKIIKDSVTKQGVRLTTIEMTLPRIVLAELNTHRQFSRNSASSRAIPVKRMLKDVEENPYVPNKWGKNQKGMQAETELDEEHSAKACEVWDKAKDCALSFAKELQTVGVHKQTTNRILEPWMWHTVIISATEWSNFFHLRNHPAAHPAIQTPAKLAQEAILNSVPQEVPQGGWHLPYIFEWETSLPIETQIRVSVARCARVSYLTHDGKRDITADLTLYDRLVSNGHLSPLEHVARPPQAGDTHLARVEGEHVLKLMRHERTGVDYTHCWFGNFRGWVQYRTTIPNQEDILAK